MPSPQALTPPDYASGGVTADAVTAWLRLPDDVDADLLAAVCAAVNVWCARLPYVRSASTVTDAPNPDDPPTVTWPADASQGALMLAARMYRRRNTPGGIEAFTDVVVYLPRRDSDVDQMLRVGTYGRVQIG